MFWLLSKGKIQGFPPCQFQKMRPFGPSNLNVISIFQAVKSSLKRTVQPVGQYIGLLSASCVFPGGMNVNLRNKADVCTSHRASILGDLVSQASSPHLVATTTTAEATTLAGAAPVALPVATLPGGATWGPVTHGGTAALT